MSKLYMSHCIFPIQKEFMYKGVNIVRSLFDTDYHNKEFIIEDIDGRWLGFCIKS